MNPIDAIFWWTGAMVCAGVGILAATALFLFAVGHFAMATCYRVRQVKDWDVIARELEFQGKLKSL